jgi:hypothetical protein
LKIKEYYFKKDERILIAIIFDSILKRNKIRDIAIYLKSSLNIEDLLNLSTAIEEVMSIPIDISPLIEIAPCMHL